ncbi:MAG TPA: hypothetical protein VF721_20225 [Pyrinomonadaceae bacterium]|jgi:hypothetical protein
MSRIIFITILIFAFCAAAFAQAEKDVCPAIKISIPDYLEINETAFAVAEAGKEIKKYNVEYVWTVQRGKLLEGQGTRKIKILRETSDQVTITLEIKGLPDCPNIFSESFGTIDRERFLPFDEFPKLPINTEKERFNNFFKALSIDADKKAIVVFSLDKNESKAEKRHRLIAISRHFDRSKIDKSRFLFMVSEDETELTALWILPSHATLGQLVMEHKDYKLIKGRNFEQEKIDELFPKK